MEGLTRRFGCSAVCPEEEPRYRPAAASGRGGGRHRSAGQRPARAVGTPAGGGTVGSSTTGRIGRDGPRRRSLVGRRRNRRFGGRRHRAGVVEVAVAEGGAGVGLRVGAAVAGGRRLRILHVDGDDGDALLLLHPQKLSPSDAMRVAASNPTAISTRRRRPPPASTTGAGLAPAPPEPDRQKTGLGNGFRAGSVWSTGSARSRSGCVRAAIRVQG